MNGEFLAGLALSVVPKTSIDGGTLVVSCEGRDAKDARLAWRVPFTKDSLHFARFVDAETGAELETRRTSTDVDVAKYKQPYEDKETEEEVPGKYNIILDLPKDDEGKVAPSGFYRLDW